MLLRLVLVIDVTLEMEYFFGRISHCIRGCQLWSVYCRLVKLQCNQNGTEIEIDLSHRNEVGDGISLYSSIPKKSDFLLV